ncbi:expressed protein [Dictyostelium purpureum]|uniref:Expressed protein n=1 Tax=Dictyostelium purpureum TaxID=5786 RepID=F1A2D4_DICPU|nr:uncharacterized protein DICPUDRAFT_99767 [Dictyostelium purpureum]EGC29640.1 expressed protein [Dictyostelium purpureum]|eukprot:XP_003293827.1 expressed protein [Dictyostelium purpureum]
MLSIEQCIKKRTLELDNNIFISSNINNNNKYSTMIPTSTKATNVSKLKLKEEILNDSSLAKKRKLNQDYQSYGYNPASSPINGRYKENIETINNFSIVYFKRKRKTPLNKDFKKKQQESQATQTSPLICCHYYCGVGDSNESSDSDYSSQRSDCNIYSEIESDDEKENKQINK